MWSVWSAKTILMALAVVDDDEKKKKKVGVKWISAVTEGVVVAVETPEL